MPRNPLHMIDRMGLLATNRLQYKVYIGLSLAVLAITAIAYSSSPLLFQKFLGKLNPLLAITLVSLLGGVLLSLLLSRGWFAIYKPQPDTRFLIAAGVATFLALLIILVDLKVTFPRDFNVASPQSLLFYPVMGYIVEIVFHVLPLSLLLLLLTTLFRGSAHSSIVWICIIIVALFEPILQIGLGWPLYVGLHLFAFNLIELALFKRYDFTTMYSFRLAYYIVWHILWGHFRLGLLF